MAPSNPADGQRLVVLTADQLGELVRTAVLDAIGEAQTKSEPPPLLDRAALAKALGCSPATLDRLGRQGMPRYLVGDSPRFDLAEVKGWLRDRGAPAALAGSQGPRSGKKPEENASSANGSSIELSATAQKPRKSEAGANGAAPGAS